MNLITILILISAGTIMIMFEIFLLPGMIVGIMGAALCTWGIYEAFTTLGTNWGGFILIITIIFNGVLALYAYKNLYKSRFAMKEKILSRVNEFEDFGLVEGNEGISITDLRPEGKALFDNKLIVVWTFEGGFISAQEPIKIVKISENKIFVNHLNK
jgi:membrane-bound ClpP family serine protease